jgi:hypothetical protein
MHLQGKQYLLTPRLSDTVCRLAGEYSAAGATNASTHSLPGRKLLAPHEKLEAQKLGGWRGGPEPKQYGGLPTLDGFHFHKSVMVKGQAAEEWKYKHQVRLRMHFCCFVASWAAPSANLLRA